MEHSSAHQGDALGAEFLTPTQGPGQRGEGATETAILDQPKCIVFRLSSVNTDVLCPRVP